MIDFGSNSGYPDCYVLSAAVWTDGFDMCCCQEVVVMHKGQITFVFCVFLIALTAAASGERQVPDEAVQAVIQKAGNADSDEVRLAYLKDLAARPRLDAALKSDLDNLIARIERWLNDPRLDYFGRQARNKDYDFKIDADSPLEPLTWLYRGRMVIWYAMESGSVWHIAERKREFLAVARGFFEKYAGAFPENRIARMYLGTPIGPN